MSNLFEATVKLANYAREHGLCESCGWSLDSDIGGVAIAGSKTDPTALFCSTQCSENFDYEATRD